MAYTYFANTIFMDPDANGYCNQIVGAVINKYGSSAALGAQARFAVTGCVAAYFQYSNTNNRTPRISFITSDPDIYDYFVNNIAQVVNVLESSAFMDRLAIITKKGIYIEIWLSQSSISTVDYNMVTLQLLSQIPSSLRQGCNFMAPTSLYVPMILTSPQSFNSGSNLHYFQDWSFGTTKLVRSWVIGAAAPATVSIPTKIKNYFTAGGFSQYSAFRVEVISNKGIGNIFMEHFVKPLIAGVEDYSFTSSGLNVTTTVEFINLDSFGAGNYTSSINYWVTALNSVTGLRDLIDTKTVAVEFTVIGSAQEYTDPKSLAFVHTVGDPLPSPQMLFINIDGEYVISFSKIFSITGPNFTDESTKYVYVKRTSGKRSVMVYLNNTVEAEGEGFLSHTISIRHSGGTIVVPVSISLAPTREIRVMPPFFSFEATIGVKEAEPQAFSVVSVLPYTYEIPQWLIVSGELGGTFTGTVRPVEAANFVPGTYTGDIVLVSAEGTKTIPVTYKVKGNSFTELLPEKINFTLDQHFVRLSTTILNVYMRVELDIRTYDFLGEESSRVYPLHVPIFAGKGEFHPGTILDAIMVSLTDISRFIPLDLESRVERPFTYYRPARLSLKMEQRTYKDDALVRTDQLNNILFMKGTRPINYANDCGIMFAQYPIRVTRNSYGIINFVKRTGIHNIEIYVNGQREKSIAHDTVQDSLFGMVVSFKNYKEGDLVFVKVSDTGDDFYQRKFYVFPENKESYHIAWATEHEQLELLEFTGSYGIDSNYERIENSVYQNLVNITEILKTNKTQPLKTNTGWLLRDNHVLLDSLMRAKRAWLFLPNTDYKIALVPQGKKLSNYDSDRSVYAYDLEFLINPDNDAKIYPR